MMNFDPRSKLNIFSVRITQGNTKQNRDHPGFVKSLMQDRIYRQLASGLERDCVLVTEGEFSTEYRLEVYVLTSEQLEKYVQHRAERLGFEPSVYIHEPVEVKS